MAIFFHTLNLYRHITLVAKVIRLHLVKIYLFAEVSLKW